MTVPVAPLQIGPYEIFEEIGRGGMSIVYRARDTRNDRIVALKVLPPELHHQRQLLNRFVKEGQSTLRLEHPNIVRTFEADIANDAFNNATYYMAMELVQGENLADYLKRRQGPLEANEALRILRQIASGLDYAHAQGILHRDIKPSNILLSDDGRALITDFGVARDLGADATLVTMPGHSVGTPAYMSPEQARGDQSVDNRSDIYSLGVVAYAMLAGKMPFDASSQLALLRKIIDDSPTPAEFVNPQLNASVAAALKTVLAKDPQARYATADRFVTALETGIAAGSIAQREPNSDATVADATVPVLIVKSVATPSSGPIDAATVSDAPVSTPRRGGNPLLIAAARSRRRRAATAAKPTPLPRQYILKPTRAQAGRGRRVLAYGLGGALLVLVLLAAFVLRDRFFQENESESTAVALVETPQSVTPTELPPSPTLPDPTATATDSPTEAVVNDSALVSESVGVATETQIALEASNTEPALKPTIEPTAASAAPPVRAVPAPQVTATASPAPTSTATEEPPTPLPTATPAPSATPLPTPSPEATAVADTVLPTVTPTARPINTPTTVPTNTPTNIPSPTPVPTATTLPTATATPTVVATQEDETPESGATKVNEVDGATYLYIAAGNFSMGSTRADDEKPLHVVELDAFWIMQTEVTNAQYSLCVAAGECTTPLNERLDDPDYGNHPVTNVSWSQANEYAAWAGGRLPTEAEWEKAARGSDQRPFPWGENAPDETLLNFDSIVNDTTPVENYPLGVSPYGLFDVAGNVEEWVEDWYAGDYYAASPAQNPVGPAEGIFRVVRGGSYNSEATLVLATTRGKAAPNRGYASVGFRVVLDE